MVDLVKNVLEKKPKILGMLTEAVAGLATITPAAGYVSVQTAVLIGTLASIASYVVVAWKNRIGLEDALDVFGVHDVGGILGAIMLGLFAQLSINPRGSNGLFLGNAAFFGKEVVAVIGASLYAFLFTIFMLWLINKITHVRVTEEEEKMSLDEALQGEQAYL